MLLIWVALFGFLSALQGSEADANSSSPVIFYSNEDSIRYIGVNDLSVRGTLISGLTKARALALYVERGWIVWSEKDGTEISRLHLPGGTKEVILHTLEVRDIAIEWETGLIYWTDHGKETIEVARIDGSYRKTLISGQYVANPMAIAVDPLRGYVGLKMIHALSNSTRGGSRNVL
ncbi:hypothetical protein OS493_029287 [Desmophyllum pertusum]|uniref:Uncharacterized protein n=1 Tax=Desmophyllum pertusum TaxID=174260 RepID=A0A9W9ZAE0_9CNID|nr:hypothetical protein OS493_029287 [Desmophyllum pertusum]